MKKIKRTNCSHSSYWYHDKVGDVYEVFGQSAIFGYRVIDTRDYNAYVRFSDAEVVEEI